MFKTNYHSHSVFCDGTGELEDYVKSAISKGFDVFGFSGHAPLPFENDWSIPKSAIEKYIREGKRLKEIYKGTIDLKIGLEIDYINELSNPTSQHFKDLKLDFIIGSVHLLEEKQSGEYLAVDYKKSEIERLISNTYNGNATLLVQDYYKKIRIMSEKGGFDIIGHLDVVKKTNINSLYFDESEYWYKKEIELTLECIAENKQFIEINTGNIINDISRIYPSPWILKLANKHNIPVMLNSDAHRPDRIDNFYTQAKTVILNAGYTELMVFRNDKWESDRII